MNITTDRLANTKKWKKEQTMENTQKCLRVQSHNQAQNYFHNQRKSEVHVLLLHCMNYVELCI
jgi:hypothetical protein